MQARNVIGSALLAAGMLMAGGGGATAEAAESHSITTSEDAQPDRSGQDFEYTYYGEPAKWNVIGGQGRSSGAWFRWGSTSSYYDYTSDTGF